MTKPLFIRLPVQQWEELKRIAAALAITPNLSIRWAIHQCAEKILPRLLPTDNTTPPRPIPKDGAYNED